MKNTEGILYGVGVGPGDPELLTVKAVRILQQADVVVIPRSDKKLHSAYSIVLEAIPEIDKKEHLFADFPMTRNIAKRQDALSGIESRIRTYLDQKKTVVFPVLGDPSIYSTYTYVREDLERFGYRTETIPGIPSFCASAASAKYSLAEDNTPIHIIPVLKRRTDVDPGKKIGAEDSPVFPETSDAPGPSGPSEELMPQEELQKALSLPGQKVLMKCGRYSGKIRGLLLEQNMSATMVVNCGMSGEKLYDSVNDFPDQSTYYTVILVDGPERAGKHPLH